jgi:hypothetical protein
MKLEFSRRIFPNPHISNFMKISPVESELFHANTEMDGRTDGYTDRHDEANNPIS